MKNESQQLTELFPNPSEKTAIVIGATGLVGYQLVQLLLTDSGFRKVKVFARRTLSISSLKLEEHIVDFEEIDRWKKKLTGDVLFSALGTTRRKAGSKQAQFRIDHHYQFAASKAAAENGVSVMVLVSSVGANPKSNLFYPRIKGLLERDVKELPFRYLVIVRPGPLYGPRPEKRTGEALGILVIRFLNRFGIMKRYKPIHGNEVAAAMIGSLSRLKSKTVIWSDQDLFKLAGRRDAV